MIGVILFASVRCKNEYPGMRGYTPIKLFHHLLRCNDLFGMNCIGLYHDNSNCDDQDCNPSCIRKDQIRLHLLLAFNWRASHLKVGYSR